MDRIIEVKVNGSYLSKDNDYAGVQYEANAKTLRIEFDEGWDGYAKTVTFWNALGENPVKRTLTADLLEDLAENTRIYLCPIPGEAMTEEGKCSFVIDGYMDGKRQRSLETTLKVAPAEFVEEAGEPADPTPSQAEQLQGQIENILPSMQEQAQIATKAAEDAATSAAGAAASEVNAGASAQRAEAAAERAGASANEAGQAASGSASSAGAAAASATAAAQSAFGAAQSERNAASSAADATAQAQKAATSAADAKTQAQNAETSASTASTKASEAKSSATSAASSASNAVGSAAQANAAAQNAAANADVAVAAAQAAEGARASAVIAQETAARAAEQAVADAETQLQGYVTEAQSAKEAAESAAENAAENAATEAVQNAETKLAGYVSDAEQAKVDAQSAAASAAQDAVDVSGQISVHNESAEAHADIREMVANAGVQADWNQNDPEARDYVKNRTHWVVVERDVIFPERSMQSGFRSYVQKDLGAPGSLDLSKTYAVTVDGMEYQCIPYADWYGTGNICLGDERLNDGIHSEDVPFHVFIRTEDYGSFYRETWYFLYPDRNTHTIKIEDSVADIEYHTIDEKFLPDTVATKADIEAAIGNALPAVTASDNGKFLRVVNGAPAWTTVQNAEEASF